MTLTREKLEADWVREMIRHQDPELELLSDDLLEASMEAMLARWDGAGPVWVFGYGSLIWNPCIHVARTAKARLYGYHRELCLWTPLGRGSRDCPGLVFGLEAGGSCHGVALAVEPQHARRELRLVWRREMVAGAYVPRWVTLHTADGSVRAIAFVMNRAHHRYAGGLSEAAKVEAVARAAGALGSCYDYVASTLDHLAEMGVRDPHLERIRRLAEAEHRGGRDPMP